jgi:hypothetical protein
MFFYLFDHIIFPLGKLSIIVRGFDSAEVPSAGLFKTARLTQRGRPKASDFLHKLGDHLREARPLG